MSSAPSPPAGSSSSSRRGSVTSARASATRLRSGYDSAVDRAVGERLEVERVELRSDPGVGVASARDREEHVLAHRESREQAQPLQGARDAARRQSCGAPRCRHPVDAHVAPAPDQPADGVEHRGLAGAVGPDEGDHLAGAHVERHLVQRGQAAECDAQRVHLEPRIGAVFGLGSYVHRHLFVSGAPTVSQKPTGRYVLVARS